MVYYEAKEMAVKFFSEKLHIIGIACAKEDEKYWYFWGGNPNEEIVGGTVVSIDKENGKLGVVEMPSHENIVRLRCAQIITDN